MTLIFANRRAHAVMIPSPQPSAMRRRFVALAECFVVALSVTMIVDAPAFVKLVMWCAGIGEFAP